MTPAVVAKTSRPERTLTKPTSVRAVSSVCRLSSMITKMKRTMMAPA